MHRRTSMIDTLHSQFLTDRLTKVIESIVLLHVRANPSAYLSIANSNVCVCVCVCVIAVQQRILLVICEEHIATPHGRECTHLLCVLAVQCPLQTSPITPSTNLTHHLKWQLDPFTQFHTTLGNNGMPQIHLQNCPFPFDNHHPNLMYPSLNRPHSPPETASRSNQPFCHSTLSGPTDTDLFQERLRSVILIVSNTLIMTGQQQYHKWTL